MTEPAPRAGVIGWPVDHSRSPLIHAFWLNHFRLPGSYERLPIPPEAASNLKQILRSGGFVGANVTLPHKEIAATCADWIDPSAAELGAVNTLWFEGDRLMASNTDGYGFLANLDEREPGWDRSTNKAVVLGAGGASRAIIQALLQRGFDAVWILNRTVTKAERLTERFGPRCRAAALSQAETILPAADVLVNTTAVGMKGEGAFDFSLQRLSPDAVVTDIVYTPLETALLKAARNRGLTCVDGLGMLLHQAGPGFEKWFGQRPRVTAALREHVLEDLGHAA
ncbi:MAG: shikimate dehydrogenase [Pseudomonadota bacterium]